MITSIENNEPEVLARCISQERSHFGRGDIVNPMFMNLMFTLNNKFYDTRNGSVLAQYDDYIQFWTIINSFSSKIDKEVIFSMISIATKMVGKITFSK